MKTVLIVLALIVAMAVGLGFYRGWFHFSSSNDAGKSNVTLSVDKDKMTADKDKVEADKDKVVDKANDLGHKAVDTIAPTTQTTQTTQKAPK
jgi:hypothetical protein